MLDKLSPCPYKTERLKLFLQISFSMGFSVLVTLLDKLVLEKYLYLFSVFTVLYVSFLLVDHDLYNDLTL